MSCHDNFRLTLTLALALTAGLCAQAQTLVYNNFGSTVGLQINGDAAQFTSIVDGEVLRLSPSSGNQAGTFFSTSQFNVSGFSTIFEFRLTTRGGSNDSTGSNGADGIAFVLQTLGSTAIGEFGQGIGYSNIGARSVAVEFDTFKNTDENDPSSNHIGFNKNGSVESVVTANVSPDFDNGDKWTAWIDYDGTTLEVRSSNSERSDSP